jgi:hypothetical protein
VGPGELVPTTVQEQLLDALCTANVELNDVFKTYDDIERIAISEREEAEVRERSRVETRLDRSVSPCAFGFFAVSEFVSNTCRRIARR